MSGLKHRGHPIVLGGVTYVVPALSLGAIEAHEEQIEKVESLSRVAQLRLTIDLAHAALQRNYPELTRAQVAEMLDVAVAPHVYAAVMGTSIPAPEEEQGEAGAMAVGTGQPSTPISAPVSAGPSTTAEST